MRRGCKQTSLKEFDYKANSTQDMFMNLYTCLQLQTTHLYSVVRNANTRLK